MPVVLCSHQVKHLTSINTKEDGHMLEQEFLIKKICDYVEMMDLRTLRMVWAYVRKLVR